MISNLIYRLLWCRFSSPFKPLGRGVNNLPDVIVLCMCLCSELAVLMRSSH